MSGFSMKRGSPVCSLVCVALWPALACGTAAGADGASSKAVDPAVQEAVQAGRSVAVPDYAELIHGQDASDFVSSNTGATGSIESLRQEGQGSLYAPGRSQADACWQKNDPRCLAVQMVDKGSTNRPSLDPDVAGDLIAGRDEVADKAEDIVDITGNGSSAGECHAHTTTITKPEETLTCDIRTNEEAGSAVEESCSHRFEEITSESSVWACKTIYKETAEETCAIPVVVAQKTTWTLTCLEGKKDAGEEFCPVTVTPAQKTQHYADCVKPQYKAVTRTCINRLVVQATASCRIGESASASNTDYGILRQDAVPGADTITLTSECVEDGFKLVISTNANTTEGKPVSVWTNADVIDTLINIQGGMVRFDGTVSCTEASCLANVLMTVWRGNSDVHVYQGEVSVRLAFTRFVKGQETEHWSQTCTDV